MPIDTRAPASLGDTAFVAGVCLLGLAYLLPGHFTPWDSFNQQWLAAFGGGLMALAAARCGGPGRPGWPWPTWLAFALAATAPMQLAWGQIHYRIDALMPALYLAGFGLMVLAGRDLGRSPESAAGHLDAMFRMFWMAALASTGIALLQWLGLMRGGVFVTNLPPAGRPFGNLAQVNHHATLLVLGLVGLAHEYERRGVGGKVATLAAGWLVFGLAMAQTRTSWLALAVLAVWWLARRWRVDLRMSVGVVVGLALALLLGTLAFEPASRLLLLAEPPNLAARLEAGPRSEMWLGMARAVWMSPWTGWGWNQVAVAHAAVATDHAAGHRLIQSAHSLLLDLPLAVGLPLALAVFALAAIWLRVRIRACSSSGQWALLAAVLAIGVHALLEYPLEYSYFLIPFGLCAGLLEGLQEANAGPRVPRGVKALVLAGVLAMTTWVGFEYMAIEAQSRTVRLSLLGVGSAKEAYADLLRSPLLDAQSDELRFMMTPARAGMTPSQVDEMRAISQRFPSPPAMLRFALAAGLNGRPDEASLELRRLCHMHLPERCKEARSAWRDAQAQHPGLGGFPVP